MNTSSIAALLQLQTVDQTLYGLETQLKHIPLSIQALELKIQQASSVLETAQKVVFKGQMEQKEIEATLKKYGEALNKYKVQQATVRKNDEYAALIKSIESTQVAISDIETKGLEALDALEQASAQFEGLEIKITQEMKGLKAEIETLESQQFQLNAQIKDYLEIANNLHVSIVTEHLNTYNRVKTFLKRPPFVVFLENGLCSGCHIKLDYEFITEIKKQTQLSFCNHCKRIVLLK